MNFVPLFFFLFYQGLSCEVKTFAMADTNFGCYTCISSDDSFNGDEQEGEDNVEIVVCSVVQEGEIPDTDDLLLVDSSLSNCYRVEVDDSEYTMIVDSNIECSEEIADLESEDLEEDGNLATDENSSDQDEQSNGYTREEDRPDIETEWSGDTGDKSKQNPDVCNRECHYTRWRKQHPFKHEWEVSYVCTICGENMTEAALSSHMRSHCQQFIHCRFCGSKFCESSVKSDGIGEYKLSSDISPLLQNNMAKDITECSNIYDTFNEKYLIVSESRNVNREDIQMDSRYEKENVVIENSSDEKHEIEPFQTKTEGTCSINRNNYSEANTEIKKNEIHSEASMNSLIEQLKLTLHDVKDTTNIEKEEAKVNLSVEKLDKADTDDDMADETERLMAENTRKWGPLVEIKINESAESNMYGIRQLKIKTDVSCTGDKDMSIKFTKMSHKAEKSRSVTIKRHSLKHGRKCLYSCGFCKQKFTRKDSVTRHKKLHANIGFVSCKICSKVFSQKYNLSRHMTAAHSNLKQNLKYTHLDRFYTCDFCQHKFIRKDNVVRHMKLHAKIGYVSCKICSKEFSKKCNLSRHMAAAHSNLKQDLKKDGNVRWSRDSLGRFQSNLGSKQLSNQKRKLVSHKLGTATRSKAYGSKHHDKKSTDSMYVNNGEIHFSVCQLEKITGKGKSGAIGNDIRTQRHFGKQFDVVYGQQCCRFCK